MPVPRKITKSVANVVLDHMNTDDAIVMFKKLSSISGVNGTVRMFFDECSVDITKLGNKRQKLKVIV